jgi:hypothetical protein
MILNTIKQVVIWGHKLHSHTHSYIHNAFYIAFKHLGYKTLWLDNKDDITNIDFSNSLFITEGQVDEKIPIILNSYYVLHNCKMDKYFILTKTNYFKLQVYTNDVINKHNAILIDKTMLTYYKDDTLFMPWATDLLPEEINRNIEKVKNEEIKIENIISLVGSITEPWMYVKKFCEKNHILFECYGGFSKNLSVEETIHITQKSILAPAFQSEWQTQNGYIPCRIFKNISYGKMGITNNPTVFELYNKEIIFDNNIISALQKGLNFEKFPNIKKKEIIINLMELTRDKHTYLNRIEQLFNFLEFLNTKSQ